MSLIRTILLVMSYKLIAQRCQCGLKSGGSWIWVKKICSKFMFKCCPNQHISMPIFEGNFSTMIFNFIQWVSSRPRYLQVDPDPEKFIWTITGVSILGGWRVATPRYWAWGSGWVVKYYYIL